MVKDVRTREVSARNATTIPDTQGEGCEEVRVASRRNSVFEKWFQAPSF